MEIPDTPIPPSSPRTVTFQPWQGSALRRINSTSVGNHVKRHEKSFDVRQLPKDLQRVHNTLKKKHGEEYALLVVFTIRTAVELHRAWHMTLLTSKLLQQLKDRFRLRMSWTLGVVKLKFRVDDGDKELHRTVPYDYDSEYQTIYCKVALALIEGHLNVHEALTFQTETKKGMHTAPSGLLLRGYPGRLLLYPLEAATCAVIFFGGDWPDAIVAAICGLAAGIFEYSLSSKYAGSLGKVMVDVLVGTITGVIGGPLGFHYKTTHVVHLGREPYYL